MSQTDKQALWEDRRIHFHESGQTAKEWCHNHHINIHTFRYWKRKESSETTPSWVAVEVEAEIPSSSIHISIGRATIETSKDVCPEHLAHVLKVVQATC